MIGTKQLKVLSAFYEKVLAESQRTWSIKTMVSTDGRWAVPLWVYWNIQKWAATPIPGGAFQIKIWGQNSLRADGNQPLYIIDGVPYSSETIGSIATSGTAPSLTSPLNSINPADIESLEVL